MINKIIQGDCLDVMKEIPDRSIDMVLTSPPYDNLRQYKGFTFNFEGISKEIYRILKDGGVCVWVVGDATIKGSETGTSFKQALYFKEIGFNLHDTMIWYKTNPMPYIKKDTYTPAFEYMFVFSKGKPKTFNLIRVPSKYAGKILKTHTTNPESIRKPNRTKKTLDTKIKHNVWEIVVAGTNYGHPAIFPTRLAEDHILSWSNEGDTILDPMAGSGTTLKIAKKNNRNYIGIEISSEYIEIIKKRLGDSLK
jgi:site-specific DNA-methyltransferase (adenine-specific)